MDPEQYTLAQAKKETHPEASAHSSHDEHHGHEHEDGVELPLPTAWPIIAALGVTLLALGVVTQLFVSLVGLLVGLAGAIGWFRDVFPVPKHEISPYAAVRAAPIKVSPRSVSAIEMSGGSHRTYYPVKVHRYSAGVKGGLAGGAAMAILAMLYGLVAQHSIWYPINLLSAAALPSMTDATVQTLDQFHIGAFLVAVISHGIICVMVGLLYTVLLPMLPARFEWLWGGIVTPLIWTALLAPIFDIINPALAEHVNWFWFVICQVSFGVVGGYVVYKSAKVETMQSWSLAARLGVHAMETERKEP
ncbi:MAG: hypothetical protein JO015_20440 [Verrucomicrobia bacterium]|nr:hypothetical protein [Verrucomicrobiota bacterium]